MAQLDNTQTEITTDINQTFAKDIVEGLKSTPKYLPSRYFYDEKGDKLFQAIMGLQEYYLTRCEFEIFSQQKEAIRSLFSPNNKDFNLIEFGAGDGLKTKILLKHFIEKDTPFTYMPVDISQNACDGLEADLKAELPQLNVQPLCAEYFDALERLKGQGNKPKVVMFLGSNIGNFTGSDVDDFLSKMRAYLNPGDLLMIGVDLKKDPTVILDAYNDKTGVTSAFNLNLLDRINRELGGNFETMQFQHYPTYDPITGDTKSYLISNKAQEVHLAAINETIKFDRAEPIFMELSKKYSLKEIENIAKETGFELREHLLDCKHYFVDTVWTVPH